MKHGNRSRPVSWRKDDPNLEELANQFSKMAADGTELEIFFFGAFSDPLDNNKLYRFPGAINVCTVIALENRIDIFLQGTSVEWWVQPIKPYTFEIITSGHRPSLKVYDITEAEWPEHIRQAHVADIPFKDEGAESATRRELIDPVLVDRGWDGLCVTEHSFVSALDSSKNRMDYVLCMKDRESGSLIPIGIIEAKREGLPPDYGLEQAKLYAHRFQENIRFVFSTNGHEFVLFDRLLGSTTEPTPMKDFPTAEKLKSKYLKSLHIIDKPIDLKKQPKRRARVDPDSIEHAKAIIETILPASVRLPCLQLLADSICYTFQLGVGKWSVTLGQNGQYVRLNVGQIEACAFFNNIVHLVLDDDKLPESIRLELERYSFLNGPTAYVKVPSSVICDFRADNLTKVRPILWNSYKSLIYKASQTTKQGTNWYKAHSSGVMEYLRQETKQQIPNPIYKDH